MQSLLWWEVMFRGLTIGKYITFHSCKRLRLCFCGVRHPVYFPGAEDPKRDKVQTYIELSETSVWVPFLAFPRLLFWRPPNFNSGFPRSNYRFPSSSSGSPCASTDFARCGSLGGTLTWPVIESAMWCTRALS